MSNSEDSYLNELDGTTQDVRNVSFVLERSCSAVLNAEDVNKQINVAGNNHHF